MYFHGIFKKDHGHFIQAALFYTMKVDMIYTLISTYTQYKAHYNIKDHVVHTLYLKSSEVIL